MGYGGTSWWGAELAAAPELAWAALSKAGLGAGPLPCLCFKMRVLDFQKTQRLSPGYVNAFTSPPTSHPVHSQQLCSPRTVPPSATHGSWGESIIQPGGQAGAEPNPQGDQLLRVALWCHPLCENPFPENHHFQPKHSACLFSFLLPSHPQKSSALNGALKPEKRAGHGTGCDCSCHSVRGTEIGGCLDFSDGQTDNDR